MLIYTQLYIVCKSQAFFCEMFLFNLVCPVAIWGWDLPFETSTVPGYTKVAKTDVPFHSLRRVCVPPSANCTLQNIAEACSDDPVCRAFNSDGFLKARANCGWGPNYCAYPEGQPFPPADRVDLYIKQGNPPPIEWRDQVAAGSMLYSQPEPNICQMPEVGNGYIASVVGFASTHIAGLFYGSCGSTHKARLPSPIAGITITNAVTNRTQAALDTRKGIYNRRYHLPNGAVVEQRILAHRERPHVLLTELELISSNGQQDIRVDLHTLYDFQPRIHDFTASSNHGGATCPNPGGRIVTRPDGTSYPYFFHCTTRSSDCGQCFIDNACRCNITSHCCQPHHGPAPPPTNGNGCAGTFSPNDLHWVGHLLPSMNALVHTGTMAKPNDDGIAPTVAIIVDDIPHSLTLSPNNIARFVAVVIASVGQPNGTNVTHQAINEFSNLPRALLLAEHVSAWTQLTTPRVEILGVDRSRRAWQLQTHFWSSYYYLMSTVRGDWSLGGMSPGGLASQNYEVNTPGVRGFGQVEIPSG